MKGRGHKLGFRFGQAGTFVDSVTYLVVCNVDLLDHGGCVAPKLRVQDTQERVRTGSVEAPKNFLPWILGVNEEKAADSEARCMSLWPLVPLPRARPLTVGAHRIRDLQGSRKARAQLLRG